MGQRGQQSTALERTILAEGHVLRVSAGPLPAEGLAAAIEVQAELGVPGKFALEASGRGAVHAEVPHLLPWAEGMKLAEQALDTTLHRLGARDEPASGTGNSTPDPETSRQLETTLEGFPWSVRQCGDAAFDIYVSLASGNATRVKLDARGKTVVATAKTHVRAASELSHTALVYFALETNARLRLTRVGVAREAQDSVRITWEAVLPGELPLQQGVTCVVEAVAHAHAASRRSVIVLGDEAIAGHYLRLRHNGLTEPTKAVAAALR